ncbi:MAG: dihydrofolate reductase [Candidatus Microsaccharimonas sossegonensis]|uniref:Dihydrofolate reductase n=1 Tax=Candidatus Microsaccharimonas sossegonensis TaxID=2506948 RepID=A0A4Q0AIE1_9BACT|nr:MAG: dihydrofolate reductase [Candidatus Microsaccharimonas sossegonensis]
MKQIIIVATDRDGVIGRTDNSYMWHLSDDLKNFKKLTNGHPIIMGHTTHRSIGRILPNRRNIILTRQNNLLIENASVVSSVEESLLEAAKYGNSVFVIGGEEVYKEFLKTADTLYLTQVQASVGGDKHFFYKPDEWYEVARMYYPADERNSHEYVLRKLQSLKK